MSRGTSAGGSSYSMESPALPSRCLSITCPNCRASVLDIPDDILKINEDRHLKSLQPKRWAKRANWISRPLNRKESEILILHGATEGSVFGQELGGLSHTHRRRASVSSEVSDSSSQTKVEPLLPSRSILAHSPSISSGKGSTLTAKRSVKFSDEPVYYDVDMFSFEQPEEIPSERRWGILSRFIAWLRCKTGGRTYTIEAEKRRPMISRPQPLAPRPYIAETARDRDNRRRLRTRRKVTLHRNVFG